MPLRRPSGRSPRAAPLPLLPPVLRANGTPCGACARLQRRGTVQWQRARFCPGQGQSAGPAPAIYTRKSLTRNSSADRRRFLCARGLAQRPRESLLAVSLDPVLRPDTAPLGRCVVASLRSQDPTPFSVMSSITSFKWPGDPASVSAGNALGPAAVHWAWSLSERPYLGSPRLPVTRHKRCWRPTVWEGCSLRAASCAGWLRSKAPIEVL